MLWSPFSTLLMDRKTLELNRNRLAHQQYSGASVLCSKFYNPGPKLSQLAPAIPGSHRRRRPVKMCIICKHSINTCSKLIGMPRSRPQKRPFISSAASWFQLASCTFSFIITDSSPGDVSEHAAARAFINIIIHRLSSQRRGPFRGFYNKCPNERYPNVTFSINNPFDRNCNKNNSWSQHTFKNDDVQDVFKSFSFR